MKKTVLLIIIVFGIIISACKHREPSLSEEYSEKTFKEDLKVMLDKKIISKPQSELLTKYVANHKDNLKDKNGDYKLYLFILDDAEKQASQDFNSSILGTSF